MSAHSSGARLSCSEGLPNMLRVDAGQRRSVSSRISFENAFVARSYENWFWCRNTAYAPLQLIVAESAQVARMPRTRV